MGYHTHITLPPRRDVLSVRLSNRFIVHILQQSQLEIDYPTTHIHLFFFCFGLHRLIVAFMFLRIFKIKNGIIYEAFPSEQKAPPSPLRIFYFNELICEPRLPVSCCPAWTRITASTTNAPT